MVVSSESVRNILADTSWYCLINDGIFSNSNTNVSSWCQSMVLTLATAINIPAVTASQWWCLFTMLTAWNIPTVTAGQWWCLQQLQEIYQQLVSVINVAFGNSKTCHWHCRVWVGSFFQAMALSLATARIISAVALNQDIFISNGKKYISSYSHWHCIWQRQGIYQQLKLVIAMVCGIYRKYISSSCQSLVLPAAAARSMLPVATIQWHCHQ